MIGCDKQGKSVFEISAADSLVRESNQFINIAQNYIDRLEKENETQKF